MPRDPNFGAKDHLLPILTAHRARGDAAARLMIAIFFPVSVHVKRVPTEKERDRGMD